LNLTRNYQHPSPVFKQQTVKIAQKLTGTPTGTVTVSELSQQPGEILSAGVCVDVLIDDELDLPDKLPAKPKHK
jgi:hypothetical protein